MRIREAIRTYDEMRLQLIDFFQGIRSNISFLQSYSAQPLIDMLHPQKRLSLSPEPNARCADSIQSNRQQPVWLICYNNPLRITILEFPDVDLSLSFLLFSEYYSDLWLKLKKPR